MRKIGAASVCVLVVLLGFDAVTSAAMQQPMSMLSAFALALLALAFGVSRVSEVWSNGPQHRGGA